MNVSSNLKPENQIATIEHIFSASEKEAVLKGHIKISLSELSALGVGFASLPETFRTVTQTVDADGLYRCVFPDGVTGKLAEFKDVSGNLGTIMDGNNIVGQAHWIKADSQVMTTTIPYNPTVLFMAMTLMSIDKKLDKIQETQKDILRFLELDKESKIRGDLNTLTEILNNYKYNWDNGLYKKSRLDLVQHIKRSASGNIDFYQNKINAGLEKKKSIHGNKDVKSLLAEIEKLFKNYQLSLYIYAFSYFLEVMLMENFDNQYLDNVASEIEKQAIDYRTLYSECYEHIDEYTKSTIEARLLKSASTVGKLTGETVAKIPIISKTQIDESLIAAGEFLNKVGDEKSEKTMERYIGNRDSGVEVFIDNINTVNKLHNKPVEMLFDNENVYLEFT